MENWTGLMTVRCEHKRSSVCRAVIIWFGCITRLKYVYHRVRLNVAYFFKAFSSPFSYVSLLAYSPFEKFGVRNLFTFQLMPAGKKNQIIDAVEVLSCYANFLDNRYCAQTSNKKSVDIKCTKIMLYLENDKNIDFTCSRECFTFSPSPLGKKWQNICPKFQNGILTRSTRTIDSTFDVAVSDEWSAKKINVKIVACLIQHAPVVQAIL